MEEQLLELIKTRRSIGKVTDEAPPRELIEKLLEAMVWAPNHYRVEPWRFYVLSGESRERLGDVFAEMAMDDFDDRDAPEAKQAADIARKRPLRSPYLIAVVSEPPTDPAVIEIENICAVAAGVQNALLLGHSMGLGVMWRTGDFASDQRVKDFFGLEDGATIVAFLYVGYPNMKPPAMNRTPYAEKTTWME